MTRRWAWYAGGCLGPFCGAMINAMVPEIASAFDVTASVAASSVTWYMVPFAGLLVVSGTLARRWGQVRTLRVAYALFIVGSVVCVAADGFGVFLLGRALQGAANAFTTPVLIMLIATSLPAERLGRALGLYASAQALGQAMAPAVGGVAASVDYRWAFVLTAAIAVLLLLITETGGGRRPEKTHAAWRALANPRLLHAALIAFSVQFIGTGLMLSFALLGDSRFDISPQVRGLVIALFGVAGISSGAWLGRRADRTSLRQVGMLGLLLLGAACAVILSTGALPVAMAGMAAAGIGATAGRLVGQGLMMGSTPANPDGAMSLGMSIQFLGTACAPVVVLLVHSDPAYAAALLGAVGVVGAALVAVPTGRRAG